MRTGAPGKEWATAGSQALAKLRFGMIRAVAHLVVLHGSRAVTPAAAAIAPVMGASCGWDVGGEHDSVLMGPRRHGDPQARSEVYDGDVRF